MYFWTKITTLSRTYDIRKKAREAQIEQPGHPLAPMVSFEEFISREIIGTPDQCMARIADLEDCGINYIRFAFDDPSQMEEAVARLIFPNYEDRAHTISLMRDILPREAAEKRAGRDFVAGEHA